MTIPQILALLGVPSLATIIGYLVKLAKQVKILMKAQQAQMRAQLLDKYNQYMRDGYISDEDLTEWENQYQSYHALGQNGVMDDRRKKLFALPNEVQ